MNKHNQHDNLRPVIGIAHGLLLSGVLWVLIIGVFLF